MKHITFCLDFISPYAFLAFEQMPEALKGTSYSVEYVPVLFAGMLKHHGQLGPAEIPAKREWTYRQVLWQAHRLGLPMQMPAAHPFHPLALLRLATACGLQQPQQAPNRFVCEQIFRHVWQGGHAADDAGRMNALIEQLQAAGTDLRTAMQSDAVKSQLKQRTDEGIEQGVFGVPAFIVDGKVFWGFDALPMLRDYLLGDAWFEGDAWDAVSSLSVGVSRKG